jgi:hypothetical protein
MQKSDFRIAYEAAYPPGPGITYSRRYGQLEGYYEWVIKVWEHVKDNKAFRFNKLIRNEHFDQKYTRYPGAMYNVIQSYKGMWLFYNYPIENFHKYAQDVIIKQNDTNLDITDYGVLIYRDCLSDEARAPLEKLYLPMLHDILDPIAEQKLRDWLPSPVFLTKPEE